MFLIVSRAMSWMSTYVVVVISPETTTRPVLTSVSQATRALGSSLMTASKTPSEIWSAILSGWPSVTDSEVNRNSSSGTRDLQQVGDHDVAVAEPEVVGVGELLHTVDLVGALREQLVELEEAEVDGAAAVAECLQLLGRALLADDRQLQDVGDSVVGERLRQQ